MDRAHTLAEDDPNRLLERESERFVAQRTLEHVLAGEEGAVIALEGEPGGGKTALLAAVGADADLLGYRVLAARGLPMEQSLPLGVARALLRPAADDDVLASAPPAARAAIWGTQGDQITADEFTVLHALYWVCSQLAERHPLLVVVDDLQWVDDATVRFLGYLRERLDGVRLVLALGTRPIDGYDPGAYAAEIVRDPRTVHSVLKPLSPAAAEQVVRGSVPTASTELCQAAYDATGGNPFFLQNLAREIAIHGDTLSVADVAKLAPRQVMRAVLRRIAAAGDDAVAVSRATAILGADATLVHVAAMAGTEPGRVSELADELASAGVLAQARPLEFAHPVIAAAVAAEIPAGMAGIEHRRAAELLVEAGAPAERVAMQLLVTEPAGDVWVVDQLLRGVREASGPGAQEAAAALMHRALAEPPAQDQLHEVTTKLGIAERHLMVPTAVERLQVAHDGATEAAERQALVVELAAAWEQRGELERAVEMTEAALVSLDRPLDAAWLEAQALALRQLGLIPADAHRRAQAQALLATLDPAAPAVRLLAGAIASDLMLRQGDARSVQRLAEIAIGTPFPAGPGWSPILLVALPAAVVAGRPELVLRTMSTAEVASNIGSPWLTAAAATWRAFALMATGDLAGAEADLADALRTFTGVVPPGAAAAAGLLAEVQLERYGPDVAEQTLAAAGEGLEGIRSLQLGLYASAGARVALTRGKHETALAQARVVRDLTTAGGLQAYGVLPWRSASAQALALAGDRDAAIALAEEQLEGVRGFGEPSAIASALTVLATIVGGDQGRALLGDATEQLGSGGPPLVRAAVLGQYGAALRRAGQAVEAREPLLEALDAAEQSAATWRATNLREELAAAGVRPRRAREDARLMLTPSELRVCRLAADGMTNREIAQALFVTAKTVETHLRAGYRKLGITSRQQLAGVLRSYI